MDVPPCTRVHSLEITQAKAISEKLALANADRQETVEELSQQIEKLQRTVAEFEKVIILLVVARCLEPTHTD